LVAVGGVDDTCDGAKNYDLCFKGSKEGWKTCKIGLSKFPSQDEPCQDRSTATNNTSMSAVNGTPLMMNKTDIFPCIGNMTISGMGFCSTTGNTTTYENGKGQSCTYQNRVLISCLE
jgi:hypothetical protein